MKTVLIVLVSVLLAVAAVHLLQGKSDNTEEKSAFARVMSSGTLRCGYILWPRYLNKDPNTGKLSGFSYDYVEELARALRLKVEWTEELGWAEFAEALKTNRVDALCIAAGQTSQRARVVNFIRPVLYTPIYAYTRAGDNRFDNRYGLINNPATTIATIDGGLSAQIALQSFPQASTFSLPELSDSAQILLNVVQQKADLTIMDKMTYLNFAKNNPGVTKQADGPPLRLTAAGLAVAKNEYDLQQMLNAGTEELIGAGIIEAMMEKSGLMDHEVIPAKLQ